MDCVVDRQVTDNKYNGKLVVHRNSLLYNSSTRQETDEASREAHRSQVLPIKTDEFFTQYLSRQAPRNITTLTLTVCHTNRVLSLFGILPSHRKLIISSPIDTTNERSQ